MVAFNMIAGKARIHDCNNVTTSVLFQIHLRFIPAGFRGKSVFGTIIIWSSVVADFVQSLISYMSGYTYACQNAMSLFVSSAVCPV